MSNRVAEYQTKGNMPSRWANRAQSLLVSASILAERTSMLDRNCQMTIAPAQDSVETRVFPVALMLRAMAVECLLKCLWLKSGHLLFENGKYKAIPNTKPHNLQQLFTAAAPAHGLSASAAETSVLERLTLFNTRGRYPSQTNSQINAPRQTPHGKLPPTYWQPHIDEPTFDTLLKKIQACAL